MVKSSSTKLMRLLGLLLSLTLLCFTYACGNDAESVESGTEAGAAAHGVHIDSFTSTGWSSQTPQGEDSATASYNATAGSSGILYVKVTDSEGNPVDNADVYFQFTANESGAILKSLGGQTGERIKATTDKGGQAMAVYKAGYNLPDLLSFFNVSFFMSQATATAGNPLFCRFKGKISFTNPILTPGNIYYLGENGQMTDIPPTTGIMLVIGSALTETDFFVNFQQPILLR